MKKPAGSVRFRFYKQKTKKNRTETDKKPEKNRAKTGKIESNRFEPVFALKKPNRTETGRFDPVSVFFSKKKISVWLFFLIKIEPNQKWSPLLEREVKDALFIVKIMYNFF